MWKKLLTAAGCGLALWLSCSPLPASSASSSSSVFAECVPYRGIIETATARWWPDLPTPNLWAAQIFQESRCRAGAVSPAGAAGLAQFMIPTWRDWVQRLKLDPMASPHEAKHAIPAGAAYMAQLRAAWRPDGRTILDRHALAAASYNAGMGNILKAQTLCGDPRLWQDISPCLAKVTGEKNAHETRGYVPAIWRWWGLLEGQ